MRIDLFAEIDAIQRTQLLKLQRCSGNTDFTDRHEIFQLQAELSAASALLGRSMTIESLYIQPLLTGVGPCGFRLASLQLLIRVQLDLLAHRLDSVCDHIQRLSPSWRATLIMEGRGFQQQLDKLIKVYMRDAHHRHDAMAAIRMRQTQDEIEATQVRLNASLALLKKTHATGMPLQHTQRHGGPRNISLQTA